MRAILHDFFLLEACCLLAGAHTVVMPPTCEGGLGSDPPCNKLG